MSDCLDIETLEAYLEHYLSPEACAEIEAHLVRCRTCRKIIANVIKSESLIPDPEIPNKKRPLKLLNEKSRNRPIKK